MTALPNYNTQKVKQSTTGSSAQGKPKPTPDTWAKGAHGSVGVTSPTSVEQAISTNPTFKPGVFTGSHGGQFAGTQSEAGAEKAQKS